MLNLSSCGKASSSFESITSEHTQYNESITVCLHRSKTYVFRPSKKTQAICCISHRTGSCISCRTKTAGLEQRNSSAQAQFERRSQNVPVLTEMRSVRPIVDGPRCAMSNERPRATKRGDHRSAMFLSICDKVQRTDHRRTKEEAPRFSFHFLTRAQRYKNREKKGR